MADLVQSQRVRDAMPTRSKSRMTPWECVGRKIGSTEAIAVIVNGRELIPFGRPEWGLLQPCYGTGNFGFLDGILGVMVDDDSLGVLNLIQTPEFREWVNLAYRWQTAGYIPEDGLTCTQDQWRQLQNQARAAFGHHDTHNPQLSEVVHAGHTRLARKEKALRC